jgi:hypothetical protein
MRAPQTEPNFTGPFNTKTKEPTYRTNRLGFLLMLLPGFLFAPCICNASEIPAQPDTNFLSNWSFYDTNAWTSDLGYAPRSWTNAVASGQGDIFSGRSVRIGPPSPAFLNYNLVEADGHTNLTLASGTLFVCFSPDWSGTNNGGSGPGHWARLVEVGSATGTNGGWGLYIDPPGCNLVFASGDDQTNSRTYLTAPIAWNTNSWHFIALVCSSTNSSLYLDGALATNGVPVEYPPNSTAQTAGFFLGNSGDNDINASTNEARGVFDDLATFDHPVDSYTVSSWWSSSQYGYMLNPNNFEQTQFIASAPSYMTNSPTFRAIAGSGYAQYVSAMVGWEASTNVWMTNVIAQVVSNLTKITFTIAGGTNDGSLYDIYGTGFLSPTNMVWSWLGQGSAGCRYSISGIPNSTAFLRLGTPQDTDSDGLPDAYELLMSRTDPQNPDTAGSGLADWFWVVYYGGDNSLDPYSVCPSGDGWTLMQAYQNGWSPWDYYTPPAPQGFTASYDPNTGAVALHWMPSPGPVTNYLLYTPDTIGFNPISLPPGTNSFATSIEVSSLSPFDPSPAYYLCAQYAGGSSDWSEALLLNSALGSDARVIRGAQGNYYVAVSTLPPSASTIRVSRYCYLDAGTQTVESLEMPVSSLTNGFALVPADWMACMGPRGWPLTDWAVQMVDGAGRAGPGTWQPLGPPVIPFFDGRLHLKQNLLFALRSADRYQYFSYRNGSTLYWAENGADAPALVSSYESLKIPTTTILPPQPPIYAFAGYYDLDGSVWARLNAFLPFEQNHIYSGFVFATNNVYWNSQPPFLEGVSDWEWNWGGALYTAVLSDPLPNPFLWPTNQVAIPAVLDPSASRWTCATPWSLYDGLGYQMMADFGLTVSGGTAHITANAVNFFGLPFVSETLAYNDQGTISYANIGQGSSAPSATLAGAFPEVAEPGLHSSGYYFARPGVDPLPGESAFSPTNSTPGLLITGFGQQLNLAAYAVFSLTNGYSNAYGYLGHYFTNAFRIDTNGNVTAQTTGSLSPYGEFTPTEPGPVALVTMPEPDTGRQGTGIVNVIKLQLDVNHDGIMDLTFGGPDNTSPARPFAFWVNGDNDGTGIGEDKPVGKNTPPDHSYGLIRSSRNLEDFARLWIVGMPTLPLNSHQFSVTLSFQDTFGNPAIGLYLACETDGGIQYLTDTNTAGMQALSTPISTFGSRIGMVSNNATFTFPEGTFSIPGAQHLLFEGAGLGSGQLVLTISQSGQTVAKASAWLDLHDVKDLFQHSRSSDVSLSDPPTTNTGAFHMDGIQTVNEGAEDSEVVVFVHGVNNSVWDYENTSQTMFKRLYWEGYHGRFVAFRWPSPTWSILPVSEDQISYFNFNRGEYIAYQSAAALKACIDDLRSRFPNHTVNLVTHSLGAAVGNQAIRLGAQVANYAMCQGAMSAWAFDGNNTNLVYSYLASGAGGTPDSDGLGGYRNAFTNSTRRVNFYNEEDWALFSGVGGIWEGNQLHFRPDHFIYYGGYEFAYTFDGTNCFCREYSGDGSSVTSRTLGQDYEKKSYVSRSRTKAVGAAGLVNAPHALTGGSVSLSVNLQDSSLGFVGSKKFIDTRPEHSGEFTKSIQNAKPFYQQLLQTGFQIAPTP